jgi:large subunit ribosomal protein L15
MDILSNLQYIRGSKKKKKRVGRGEGSGHGGTATRGMNGANSRSGNKYKPRFEGGQMPLFRRIPKKGFRSPHKIEYQVINLYRIQELINKGKIDKTKEINAAILFSNNLISKANHPYKILGVGEINDKITIEAHSFSESAKEKIESKGGKTKVIEL